MKTHYDLFGLDPSADAETIKKAFRREIAKYHPDKVTHLASEFQEMAVAREAELTAAYKVLTDPKSREEYDREIHSDRKPGSSPKHATAQATAERASAAADAGRSESPVIDEPADPPSGMFRPPSAADQSREFDRDRAGRDDIVRRATMARVREVVQRVIGDCSVPNVRGFDFACLPLNKTVASRSLSQLFKKQTMPVVLVRLAARVDGAVVTDALADAFRARVTMPGQALVVMLIGNQLAPNAELARVLEEARRKSPTLAASVFLVPVDVRDWSAKIPLNAPEVVRTLVDRLKTAV